MSVLNKQFFFFVFALSMGLGAKAQELPPVLFTMDTMDYSTKFLGMSVCKTVVALEREIHNRMLNALDKLKEKQ